MGHLRASTVKGKLSENIFAQLIIATLIILVAWAIPASLFLLDNRDIFGYNITSGAEANGIRNLTIEDDEPVEGLPSTTYDFTIDTSDGYTTPVTALGFLGNSIAGSKDSEVANISATGETQSGKQYLLEFYGSSKTDYQADGEFDTTTQLLSRLLTGTTQYIHIVSTPASDGQRYLNVTVAGDGEDVSPATVQHNFNSAVNKTSTTMNMSSTIVEVSVKKGASADSETPITEQAPVAEAQFWADTGEALLSTIPASMWDFLANSKGDIGSLTKHYAATPTASTSVLTVTVDTEGEGGVTKAVNNVKTLLKEAGVGNQFTTIITDKHNKPLSTIYPN